MALLRQVSLSLAAYSYCLRATAVSNPLTILSFVSNAIFAGHRSAASNCPMMTSTSKSLTLSWSGDDGAKSESLEKCILPLSPSAHKGSSGRVGVLGGSERYTGAPYYVAMASLKVGADLAYIFCAKEAAIPIKCYSPELMVAPVYSADEFDRAVGEDQQAEALVDNMVQKVVEMMPRLHALVVGPGMGRCPLVMEATSRILQQAMQHKLSLVLDADSLYMLTLKRYHGLLQQPDEGPDNQHVVVLTPNAVEYKRLMDAQDTLDTPKQIIPTRAIVVKKGQYDEITTDDTTLVCGEQGGWKRSGGVGDILAGAIGTFAAWNQILSDEENEGDMALSCWSACCVVKRATKRAFEAKRRAMTAPDILDELGNTFDEMTRE